MDRRRGLSTWIAGLVVGVGAGVLSLTFPILGWLIVVAFLVGLIRPTPRIPAVGGLFFGLGTIWLALLPCSGRAVTEVAAHHGGRIAQERPAAASAAATATKSGAPGSTMTSHEAIRSAPDPVVNV
jgi:hypothetical protein